MKLKEKLKLNMLRKKQPPPLVTFQMLRTKKKIRQAIKTPLKCFTQQKDSAPKNVPKRKDHPSFQRSSTSKSRVAKVIAVTISKSLTTWTKLSKLKARSSLPSTRTWPLRIRSMTRSRSCRSYHTHPRWPMGRVLLMRSLGYSPEDLPRLYRSKMGHLARRGSRHSWAQLRARAGRVRDSSLVLVQWGLCMTTVGSQHLLLYQIGRLVVSWKTDPRVELA